MTHLFSWFTGLSLSRLVDGPHPELVALAFPDDVTVVHTHFRFRSGRAGAPHPSPTKPLFALHDVRGDLRSAVRFWPLPS